MTTRSGTPDIMTVSGKFVDYLQPDPASIDLYDLAHGLSLTCRFAGQCSVFYSVAEHSVRVADLVPQDMRLAALLHDAAEAYMTDLPKPLKRLLPEYKQIEDRLLTVILRKFGIGAIPEAVKRADMIMLATEGRDLCHRNWEWVGLPEKPRPMRTPTPWPSSVARDIWVGSVLEITNGLVPPC